MQINWNEHCLRHNNPGGKTYYIIRRRDHLCGLFSNYHIFADHMYYALSKGWLPVVDMKHYPNAYLEPQLLGKVNAWEYYFRQPFDLTLDEAYSADNVVVGTGEPPKFKLPNPLGSRGIYEFYANVNGILSAWQVIDRLGLFRLQPKMIEDITQEYNRLISKDDRVLGVLVRGTDFNILRPQYATPLGKAVAASKDLKAKWNCNKIFLATEDYDIVTRFKEEFADDCLVVDRQYVNYDGRGHLALYHINRKNDFFLLGKEYLTQIVILSKCNCLCAMAGNGTAAAMIMSDGYERVAIFDREGFVDSERIRKSTTPPLSHPCYVIR